MLERSDANVLFGNIVLYQSYNNNFDISNDTIVFVI